jgi:hypothetical protein
MRRGSFFRIIRSNGRTAPNGASKIRDAARASEGEEDFVMIGSRRTDASHWLGIIGLLLSFSFILALIIR